MDDHEREITSWSYRTFQARKNYQCANCGGIIPKGTTYLRHVVRLGPQKGKDPLRNVQQHQDCQAPWYHASNDDWCRNLRQLPGKIPPPEQQNPRLMTSPLSVRVDGVYGTLLWQLPADLSQRMLHAPNEELTPGARAEIDHALMLVMKALHQAAGNRKKGKRLSHILHELQLLVE